MKQVNRRTLLTLASATLLAGCQTTMARAPAYAPEAYYPAYYPAPAAVPPLAASAADVEPAAGPVSPQPYAPVPVVSTQQMNVVEGALTRVEERLQRVEKAMLRLDRRMQLVERKELDRMTGAEGEAYASAITPESSLATASAMSGGFQTVGITSSLQAAPVAGSGFHNVNMQSSGGTAAKAGLPSLADPATSSRPPADSELAIWTVSFAGNKVWPDRSELPGSRSVVEALRSGQPVTVFARGQHPNSVMFRDRVKSISRYLGKVSEQDSVPIAALPGTHLAEDTIEIFATY